MGARRIVTVVLLLAGCGGGAGGAMDGGSGCEESCLLGWWVRFAGPCSGCELEGAPRECQAEDCEMLEIRNYAGDGTLSTLSPVYSSESQRSFTHINTPGSESWELSPECRLAHGGEEPGREVSCTEAELAFPTAVFERAPAGQTGAFEAALEAGGPCEHSY